MDTAFEPAAVTGYKCLCISFYMNMKDLHNIQHEPCGRRPLHGSYRITGSLSNIEMYNRGDKESLSKLCPNRALRNFASSYDGDSLRLLRMGFTIAITLPFVNSRK